MSPSRLRLALFLLFVASGFCSLLYQVVWLRLAFAAFGVVTPVLSVVLSVFMLGLALGSWLAGRWSDAPPASRELSPAIAYGLAEWGIGAGAFVVPWLFGLGEQWLLAVPDASSGAYHALSALVITLAVIGFTTLMGMTFPLMLAFIRSTRAVDPASFSFLYLGNVIGAMAGASVSAVVLIEMLGFRGTLWVAAAVNLAIGIAAFMLEARRRKGDAILATAAEPPPARPASTPDTSHRGRLALLFVTGFATLAMEVVWTRAFTPVLQTTIYAFAALLTVYLAATWVGSALYRLHLHRGTVWSTNTLLGALAASAVLPLVLNDPRLHRSAVVVLLSIVPLSALAGYLMPRLIDDHSRGDPRAAGAAYAVNVVGCIVGPIFAGYVLLPRLGVKGSLLLLAALLFALCVARIRHAPNRRAAAGLVAGGALLPLAFAFSTTYEDPALYRNGVVRRDHTATVLSSGDGMQKELLVNGVGITVLTPITKFMAHLPAAFLAQPPRSTLVICFGMGTTFRSLASMPGRTTAAELVPSVRDAFGYYHADAQQVLARPGKRIVVDDGRRFLRRTGQRFDIITIDPPPPLEAAGSSLLYSVEFYRIARSRLAPGGILQQWSPGGDDAIDRAIGNSIREAFPHVKVYRSIESSGSHYLASEQPLVTPTVAQALQRQQPAATADMMEWFPGRTAEDVWAAMLKQEVEAPPPATQPQSPAIRDDRPFNEYFLVRRLLDRTPAK